MFLAYHTSYLTKDFEKQLGKQEHDKEMEFPLKQAITNELS